MAVAEEFHQPEEEGVPLPDRAAMKGLVAWAYDMEKSELLAMLDEVIDNKTAQEQPDD